MPDLLDWYGRAASSAGGARHAELYDLATAHFAEDVEFYRQIARRTGGPILELGCGTGRVTIPLARDGHRVVGIDTSAAQLERARRKAKEAGLDIEFLLGDMRDFALPQPFRLIVVPLNSFLILSPEERPASLARVREHLARDGLFVLDVFQPDPEKIAALQGGLVHEWTREDPGTGRQVASYSASRADVDGVTYTFLFDEIEGGEILRRHFGSGRLHYLYRRELELLLAASGFALEVMYGSYELEPVTSRSPKLLAVARRRERGDGVERRRP